MHKNTKKLLYIILVLGLNGCSAHHSTEGGMAVTAVLLSPILIPIAIVKETGKATKYMVNVTKTSLVNKSAIKQGDIKGLIEILEYYSTDSSKTDVKNAAKKMIELNDNHQLDLTQMDQVLYLAHSYSILSRYNDQNGDMKINNEKISKAWKLIQIYSEQIRLYDEEMDKLKITGDQNKINCLCNKYNTVGDSKIFDDIRVNLYLAEYNGITPKKRLDAIEKCEENLPKYEGVYLDRGGINADLFCSNVRHGLLLF